MYPPPFDFTGSPDVSEDPVYWLATIDNHLSNFAQDWSNREKTEFFARHLPRRSPAKTWFTALDVNMRKRYHNVRLEFIESWVSDEAFDVMAISIPPPIASPAPLDNSSVPSYPISANIPALLVLLAAQNANGVSQFCQEATSTDHPFLEDLWNIAFAAGSSSGLKRVEDSRDAHTEATIRAYKDGRTAGYQDAKEHLITLISSASVAPDTSPDLPASIFPDSDASTLLNTTSSPTPAHSASHSLHSAPTLGPDLDKPPQSEPIIPFVVRDLSGLRSEETDPWTSIHRRAGRSRNTSPRYAPRTKKPFHRNVRRHHEDKRDSQYHHPEHYIPVLMCSCMHRPNPPSETLDISRHWRTRS